ncbi:MAG: NAD(P)-dependent oxidoreductase, partial [Candidatus Hodarchaeota archaeon]
KERCLMNDFKKSTICIEQTTKGGNLIRKLDKDDLLTEPVFLVSKNEIKKLVDNFTGTSESVAAAISFLTNTQIKGKNILVIGYGSVGKGLVQILKNYGANVMITEIDALNSCKAYFEVGIKSKPLRKAIQKADIVLTCTGQLEEPVLDNQLIMLAKSGTYFANAGSAGEIPIYELEKVSNFCEKMNEYTDIYSLNNEKKVFLLAEGQPLNLTAGNGNAIESITTTFLLETLTAKWALKNIDDLEPKIYPVPDKITRKVSKILCEVYKLYYEEDDL